MYFRTNEDMNRAILHGLREVPDDVDLIVGIPRSGLLAAMLFSLYLNKPITDLEGLLEGRTISTGKRPLDSPHSDPITSARRILVVDDCISKGTEVAKARAKLEKAGLAEKAIILAVYSFPENPGKADIVLEVVPRPMVFQWSLMHSPNIKKFCIDFDGILCVDPITGQNDDSQKYRETLEGSKPLFKPINEIGWIVTCRPENYRKETEEWLARHGIRYQKLVMMDDDSHAESEDDGRHAEYKADVYLRSGKQLFIESRADLADQISTLTDRPVLCFTTNALHHYPISQRLDVMQVRARYFIRRLRQAPRKLGRAAKHFFQW